MDKKMKEEKLKMWKQQRTDLQKQLADTLKRKGAAGQEGDLKENAGYLMAIEEAEVIAVRLNTIQKMIQDLEKSPYAEVSGNKGEK